MAPVAEGVDQSSPSGADGSRGEAKWCADDEAAGGRRGGGRGGQGVGKDC